MSYDQTERTSSRIQARSAPKPASGAPAGIAGAASPEPDDERQERDVQRPEDRRHPGRETVVRVQATERGDRDQHDADGAQQQAAPLQFGRDGRVEDDSEGERGPERRKRRVSGRVQEPEHLDGREDRHDGDGDGQDRAAQGQHDEQDRDKDGRRDGPLAHASRPGRQRPNRRWRRANSMSASSKASGPKAGHSRSVKYSSAYCACQIRKLLIRCSRPVRIRRSSGGRPTV